MTTTPEVTEHHDCQMRSRYDNGFCSACGSRHIRVDELIEVYPAGGWAAHSCVQKIIDGTMEIRKPAASNLPPGSHARSIARRLAIQQSKRDEWAHDITLIRSREYDLDELEEARALAELDLEHCLDPDFIPVHICHESSII
jgi:hypothetical protein